MTRVELILPSLALPRLQKICTGIRTVAIVDGVSGRVAGIEKPADLPSSVQKDAWVLICDTPEQMAKVLPDIKTLVATYRGEALISEVHSL
jgi:hypothetical protein